MSAERTRKRRLKALLVGGALLLLGGLFVSVNMFRARHGLPFRDSFAEGKISDWTGFGGSWNTDRGYVVNDSDERGAKLVTGSPSWKDYVVSADMRLLGNGDAGLIVRANDIEEGIDAYSGYFAGLRTSDNSILLGRANYGWLEFKPVPMPGGVKMQEDYHLEVGALGCVISFTATAIRTGESANVTVRDPGCPSSGKVGLRSMSAGGMWRDIQVRSINESDRIKLARPIAPVQSALYPTNRSLNSNVNVPGTLTRPQEVPPVRVDRPPVQPIRTLRLLSTTVPAQATVRGAVVLTTPNLFVQDATGGVEVLMEKPTSLKVGDQVEVGGLVYPGAFRTFLRMAKLYSLGTPDPTPPLSVTADQAAKGTFDGMFLEIEGRLTGKVLGPGNTLRLELSAGDQKYIAILNTSEAYKISQTLEMASTLRLRGVCLVDGAVTRNTVPFALLLRSYGGIEVVTGPPWWTATHLVAFAAGLIVLLFLGTVVYGRAEQWRLRAVLRERERLAHEIHDTLAQSFAGIGFQLRAIRKRLARETVDAPALLLQIDQASDLVRHSHDEARRSIAALRLECLPEAGLLPALEECARRMVDCSIVTISAEEHGEVFTLPLRTLDGLLRIGQEAIANAIQHGLPTRLSIATNYSKNRIEMVVQDNGKGFSGDTESDGFGLIGMRRRMERLNGTLDITSVLNEGTRVAAIAPVFSRSTLYAWLSKQEQ